MAAAILLKLKTCAHYIVVDNAVLINKNIRQTGKYSKAVQKKLACCHAS